MLVSRARCPGLQHAQHQVGLTAQHTMLPRELCHACSAAYLMATLSKTSRFCEPNPSVARIQHTSFVAPRCFWWGTANAVLALICIPDPCSDVVPFDELQHHRNSGPATRASCMCCKLMSPKGMPPSGVEASTTIVLQACQETLPFPVCIICCRTADTIMHVKHPRPPARLPACEEAYQGARHVWEIAEQRLLRLPWVKAWIARQKEAQAALQAGQIRLLGLTVQVGLPVLPIAAVVHLPA